MNDDAIWLLRVAAERTRQRAKWGTQVLPLASPRVAALLVELEAACRAECDSGAGSWAAVAGEELGEIAREEFGTIAFERECVQLAAVGVQMAQASRALRESAPACARMRENAPTPDSSEGAR